MAGTSDHGADSSHDESALRSRSRTFMTVWVLCGVLAFSGFAALGIWQVYRLNWKLDLIERVNQRVDAPAQAAPGPSQWASITSEKDSYRHVRVTGKLLPEKSTFVKASTKLGSGFWMLTPIKRPDGSLVLINRGFVTDKASEKTLTGDTGTTTITGLLRITEGGGSLLQDNQPAEGRWYSRDVNAIASARNLSHVAPYFIDADGDGKQTVSHEINQTYRKPVGGLTVVSFYNHHLLYAITWFALALMAAAGTYWFVREERQSRYKSGSSAGG